MPSYVYKLSESKRRTATIQDLLETNRAFEHPVNRCGYKLRGYEFASQHGLRHAEVFGVFEDTTDVDWEELPNRFAIKTRIGCSGTGVFLLERSGDSFLDLRRDETLTLSEISEKLKIGFWIEQLFYPLPPDWKCYSFNGVVGLVVCIDRETEVYQTFDGNLRPAPGAFRRYQFREAFSMEGPLHPSELLAAARMLSRAVRHPHCRVDLYDMPDGVYLGELADHPGAGCNITGEWDVRLGALWEQAESELIVEGFPPFSRLEVSEDRSILEA